MPGTARAAMARRALATILPQARSLSSCSVEVIDMTEAYREHQRV